LLSAYHLAYSQNACNFSVPGAGKTSIVYAAYSHLNSFIETHKKFVDKILVIGPLSSFGPWENEYTECFGKKPSSQRLSSNISIDKDFFFETNIDSDLVLISYQGIINITDSIINYLKRNRVMIVLDEAHKIKNIDDGSIANAVLRISKYANSRVVLTGTPVPNGYEDLYNIFKFIWPNQNLIGFHPYQLKDMTDHPNEELVDSLIKNIEPYFIRIRKSDMGNMPIPNEIKSIEVEMDNEQRLVYESIEKRVVEEFLELESDNLLIDLKKAKLIRLMQVASNLNLLKKPLTDNFDKDYIDDNLAIVIKNYNKIPPKFYATLKLVKSIINNNEKIIIWCTYIDNIKELSSFLSNCNIYNKLLYGDIPTKSDDTKDEISRELIIDEFHKNPDLRVIIANPHAVGESISLHKACHNALYFEKSFNATHFLQSRDRIHRYGLKPTDIINYYYLISKDTVDETIHERLFFKKKRMEEIIEKSPIPLFDNLMDDIGNEDIKSVVRAYVKRNQQ